MSHIVRSVTMNNWLLALAAVFCNVAAQIAMKWASSGQPISSWRDYFSFWILFAVAAYGASFLLTVKVFSSNALSLAGPLMAGLTFVSVAVAGHFIFQESIGLQRMLGIAAILGGVFLLTK